MVQRDTTDDDWKRRLERVSEGPAPDIENALATIRFWLKRSIASDLRLALELSEESLAIASRMADRQQCRPETEWSRDQVRRLDRALTQLCGSRLAQRRERVVSAIWALARDGAAQKGPPVTSHVVEYANGYNPPSVGWTFLDSKSMRLCFEAVQACAAYLAKRNPRGREPWRRMNAFLEPFGLGAADAEALKKLCPDTSGVYVDSK